jgi:hypothetical protein
MLRKVLYVAVAAFLANNAVFSGGTANAQEWARKMFDTTEHDFGTVGRGTKAEFDFVFTNKYIENVHIASAYSSCGCTSVEVVHPTLKSWEQGAIHARFNTPSFLGSRAATLTVVIDKPFPAEVLLHVRGVIRSDISFQPGSVQFGDLEQGKPAEQRVRVSYFGWSNWNIVDVKSSNPHLSVTMLPVSAGSRSYDLAVKYDGLGPTGYLKDYLMLVSNEGSSVEMPLAVEGRVMSSLSVSPSNLFMGVLQPGQDATKSLVVRGNREFRILSITCDDTSFTFDTKKDESAKTLHVVPVRYVAGKTLGKISKTVRITTDLGSSTLELTASAVVGSDTADATK